MRVFFEFVLCGLVFPVGFLSPDTDDADDTRMLASLAPLPMVAAAQMNTERGKCGFVLREALASKLKHG